MATLNGKVNRVFLANTGNFGKLTIEATNGRRLCKHDVKVFDKDLLDTMKQLKPGQPVSVEYALDTECLKDKSGQDVMVDNYKAWVTCLKLESINGVVKSDETPGPLGNDKVPF